MNIPSRWELEKEIRLLDIERETRVFDADEAFVAGMIRGLEWALGKGMSPSEFLRACDRAPKMH